MFYHLVSSEPAGSAIQPNPPSLGSDRRNVLRTAALGMAGFAVGAQAVPALAQAAPSAGDVFNFALNFEYLGAEFYSRAAFGTGLPDADVSGTGTLGPVTGGRQVAFTSPAVANVARELAVDEQGHARFLRSILGSARIARPAINLVDSFTTLARFSGLIPGNGTFDPFANDTNFLLAAFVLEDVCVTALKGGTPFIRDNEFLEAAGGLIATEGYHAGILRTLLAQRNLFTQARQISDLRDFYDGPTDIDQGIGTADAYNLVPADSNAIAFSRTPQQVLAIAYGSPGLQPGGFFPNGTNGAIR